MEFSKQLQIAKLALIALLIIFAGVSWLVRGDFPEALVTWGVAAIGLSDAPYQVKSAVENKAKIEGSITKKEVGENDYFYHGEEGDEGGDV